MVSILFESRDAFERVLDPNGARYPSRTRGVTFGPIDELPFADVDAWLDHALPVAGPRAYPLAADLRRDGTVRRPDARVAAMPRVAERSSVRIARMMEGRAFESLDDVNAELDRAGEVIDRAPAAVQRALRIA